MHKENGKWKKPRALGPHHQKNKSKWCDFHDCHVHDIEECYQLKDQIEEMVQKGYLDQYLADKRRDRQAERILESLTIPGKERHRMKNLSSMSFLEERVPEMHVNNIFGT